MISSRKLSDLEPDALKAANAALADCAAANLDVLIYCTYRDFDAQSALYASGRTKPGEWKTNAKPGESWHNWRAALDLVPMRHGKPVWGAIIPEDLALWDAIASIFKAYGFEWGGDWAHARDLPHFQRPDGRTASLMMAKYPKGIA